MKKLLASLAVSLLVSVGVSADGLCYFDQSGNEVCQLEQIVSFDPNGDGLINEGDIFYLVAYVYSGGPTPVFSGDANGDCAVDSLDINYLVNYLYTSGPVPVPHACP